MEKVAHEQDFNSKLFCDVAAKTKVLTKNMSLKTILTDKYI